MQQSWFVVDVRNNNPPLGPFSPEEASSFARRLNDFVRRNGGVLRPPFLAAHAATVELARKAFRPR
jgi:hypothetical protein